MTEKSPCGWETIHDVQSVTEYDIAEPFGLAYGRAATMANATSAYRKTGIHPFNPQIFRVEDFLTSAVTDICDPDQTVTSVVEDTGRASFESCDIVCPVVATIAQAGSDIFSNLIVTATEEIGYS